MGLINFLKNKFGKKKPEENYVKGLAKSRAAFSDRLALLAKKHAKLTPEYFEELETILIESDVGVSLTLRLIDELLERGKENPNMSSQEANDELIDMMFVSYVEKGESIVNELSFKEGVPTVLLMEGVNGVGKTTSIAKLAYRYKKQGKKILLAAGDTFRAGAVEQLSIWASRLEVDIVKGKPNADPASVAFDGAKAAREGHYDLLIVDTAGRQQTKANLMNELGKIRRVIARELPESPIEAFLVIDATTGQNGVSQAKAFAEASPLTGIVITKMDGTSKGGIILSIRDEIGAPVRFIGLGEKMEDLVEFDLDEYLHALLVGDDNG